MTMIPTSRGREGRALANSKEIEFTRWLAGLVAGRRGRILADPPPREEAAEKLAAWRASRKQAKRSEQQEQELAELKEIEALEVALKKESPA